MRLYEFEDPIWPDNLDTHLNRLTINPNITVQDPMHKVFSFETYTQDLYNLMVPTFESFSVDASYTGKDVKNGQFLKITDIISINGDEIYFEVNKMTSVFVNMKKERKFLDYHSFTKESFIEWITDESGREDFLNKGFLLYIERTQPVLSGSLTDGLQKSIKDEWLVQINHPTSAYYAKVIGKNQGGFLVDVFGIQGFLPGGQAAANKILNFDSYVGRTIPVMVEDYLSDINTFIFSHKKYLKLVLPQLVSEFDTSILHKGTITGSNEDLGIFVEFNDIFTGLLHTSKMLPTIKENFDNKVYRPGNEIECWVIDISKNNQFILSSYPPGSQENEPNAVLKPGIVYDAIVTGSSAFGVFVKLKNNEVGLIPSNNLQANNSYKVTSGVKVKLRAENYQQKDGKYFFNFVN